MGKEWQYRERQFSREIHWTENEREIEMRERQTDSWGMVFLDSLTSSSQYQKSREKDFYGSDNEMLSDWSDVI